MELAVYHQWWKHRGGQELRRLLMEEWDPIGVEDARGAADEYDGYRGAIVQLLRGGASADRIAEHLALIEQTRMASLRPLSNCCQSRSCFSAGIRTLSPGGRRPTTAGERDSVDLRQRFWTSATSPKTSLKMPLRQAHTPRTRVLVSRPQDVPSAKTSCKMSLGAEVLLSVQKLGQRGSGRPQRSRRRRR